MKMPPHVQADAHEPPGRTRSRINLFFYEHDVLWELVMAGIMLAYFGAAFWADEKDGLFENAVLIGFAAIFLGEFAVRFWASTNRAGYAKKHWIDAATAVPFVGPLRALRLLRLIRLVAMARGIKIADYMSKRSHRQRKSMWFLGPLLFSIWVGSAYIFWMLDHGAPQSSIHTFWDALYMSFAIVTTFGYTNVQPVQPVSQVVASLLIFVGIGLVGFASAQLTDWFLRNEDTNEVVKREVGELKAEIANLRMYLEGTNARSLESVENHASFMEVVG